MHRLTIEKVKLFRKNFFIPHVRSKKKFKQKTHKQHTLFYLECYAYALQFLLFLKHPVKGDDRDEIFYTFASENNKIIIIKSVLCAPSSFLFLVDLYGDRWKSEWSKIFLLQCVCAMEIQSWQASRQLCKRGAFHSALLVKVAACNIYQVCRYYV